MCYEYNTSPKELVLKNAFNSIFQKSLETNSYITDAVFYQQTVTVSDAAKSLSEYIGASQSRKEQTRIGIIQAAGMTKRSPQLRVSFSCKNIVYAANEH